MSALAFALALLASTSHAGPAASDGWISVDAKGQCAKTHPPRHRIEVVRDSFKKREDLAGVEDAARIRAIDALLASACADRSPAQCDAIRARVGVDVAVDRERGLLCAAALVASDVVKDPDGRNAHEAAVRRLSAEAAVKLAGVPVRSVTARWDSGCGAGDAGARLAGALRAGLIANDVAISNGIGDRLVAKFGSGDPVLVELWRYPGANSGSLLGVTRLSAAWLGLYEATGDKCRGDAALGLTGGQRKGADGLTVSLRLETDGALCPGETTRAVLRPSDLARVQVWSVGRTGEAWLTWSSESDPAVAGPLDRRVTLDMEAAHVPALGEETLLVVAVPPGVHMPVFAPGCRIGSLVELGVPRGAAMASAPFTVLPPGRERCPAVAGAGLVSWADYQSAPSCR